MNGWIGLQAAIAAFLAIALLIAVGNIYTLRRLGSYPPPIVYPRVSIMVPARNEEASIEACVTSLLAQEYPDFEVIVLDDNSEDRTGEILARLQAATPRLQIMRGRPLPEGWLGKHWAAQQMSMAASGELLFFTDADTLHSPGAIRGGVAALLHEDADMLSGLPQELVGTWAERLMVPVMFWGILAFLPLWLAYRLRAPSLSTAIGQYMLFRRPAFEAVGGFESVRQEILDDVAIARQIKSHGLRWRLASARAQTRCRMYHNTQEVFAGFGKNANANLGGNIWAFFLSWSWLALVFVEPVVLLLLSALGIEFSTLSLRLAAVSVVFSLFLWALSNRRFGFPMYLVPLYPATILMAYAVAIYSIISRLTGRVEWKGRAVGEPVMNVDQAEAE